MDAFWDHYTCIAVYGTGTYAKDFLQNYSGNSLAAVFDRVRKNGEFCGYPIRDIEDISSIGVELVIIAAPQTVEEIIFRRIERLCAQNNVDVFDVMGRNLRQTTFGVEYNDKASATFNDIIAAIDAHDVISFDIFDTLIMRKTLYPEDVFELVASRGWRSGISGEEFKANRVMAELSVLDEGCHTLDAIYDKLQKTYGFTDEIRAYLLNTELEAERDVIVARNAVVRAFRYAIQKKKLVYLTTDMYLPEEFLRALLCLHGIEGYEKIIISGYEGTTKSQNLFGVLQNIAPSGKILHIGDNKQVDCLMAHLYGIDSFWVPSALEIWRMRDPSIGLEMFLTVNDRTLLGIYLSRCFQNPFENAMEEVEEEWGIYDFAFSFAGPLLTYYILWLVQKVRNKDYEKLLFVARDGYLLMKLYQWFCNNTDRPEGLPPGCYFYTSRRAAIRAGLCKQDIEKIAKQMPEGAVFFEDGHIDSNCSLQESEEQYQNFALYLKREDIKQNGKYALVDILSSGTSQYFLQNIFAWNIEGLNMIYYIGEIGKIREPLRISAMYLFPKNQLTALLTPDNNKIMETICTSYDASVSGYGGNGEVVFTALEKEDSEKIWLKKAQQGVMDYFSEFIGKYYVPEQGFNANIGAVLFFQHERLSQDAKNRIFEGSRFYNDILLTSSAVFSHDREEGVQAK